MAVDLRKVKKLIELVEESGIAELEVTSGDETVRIAMPRSGLPMVSAPAQPVARESIHTQPAASASTGGQSRSGHAVPAPMAGTFYSAPHPDAAPYVESGSEVAAGDVLCIIESMKMMHEIHAVDGGRVVEVCVANGQPVSTGETLFRLS